MKLSAPASSLALLLALASTGSAQTSVPLLEPKPVFVPGMYETEARNSAFKNHPVTSTTCVPSADYDAFRDETMAQYLIEAAPKYSSSILIMMRRVGQCPGQVPGEKL